MIVGGGRALLSRDFQASRGYALNFSTMRCFTQLLARAAGAPASAADFANILGSHGGSPGGFSLSLRRFGLHASCFILAASPSLLHRYVSLMLFF